jgi:hypothetical protein
MLSRAKHLSRTLSACTYLLSTYYLKLTTHYFPLFLNPFLMYIPEAETDRDSP